MPACHTKRANGSHAGSEDYCESSLADSETSRVRSRMPQRMQREFSKKRAVNCGP